MTLIAVIDPTQGSRVLIGDILVSSKALPTGPAFQLPSRAYISPSKATDFTPVDVCRKIIEIKLGLCALWAGNYLDARRCAFRLRERFGPWRDQATVEALVAFGKEYDQVNGNTDAFTMLVAPANGSTILVIGRAQHFHSRNYGSVLVAGRGHRYFEELANCEMEYNAPPNTKRLSTGTLNTVCHLLAEEIITEVPQQSLFGAG
jgi:hypothetical protein